MKEFLILANKYNIAQEKFKDAEIALGQWQDRQMAIRNTVKELQELIDLLPKGFSGVRRVYERIYTLTE